MAHDCVESVSHLLVVWVPPLQFVEKRRESLQQSPSFFIQKYELWFLASFLKLRQ